MRQSENLAPQNLTMGSHVGYKEVSVTRPNNGKTTYKFSTPALYMEDNDCYQAVLPLPNYPLAFLYPTPQLRHLYRY